jgi:hypothetical protein
MHAQVQQKSAIHIYYLAVGKSKTSDFINYCKIIEIHSPEYLDLNWLKALYENEYATKNIPNTFTEALLGRLKSCVRQF